MAEYIERDALLAEVLRMRNCHLLSKSDGAKVEKMVRSLPTADVEPVRHGRWDDSFDGITPYCSVCGRSHSMLSNRTPPYCPNCGAKMDGEVAVDG